MQPSFRVTDGLIAVALPVVKSRDLGPGEEAVLRTLRTEGASSRPNLEHRTGFSQSKVSRILRNLVDRGLVHKIGAARATLYTV